MARFLKNALFYSATNFVSQILIVVQAVIIRSLLAPHILGMWNFVGVIQGFMSSFDLGISSAAIRELPMLRGQGRADDEVHARATAFWSQVGQSLFLAALTLAYMLFSTGDRDYHVAFFVAAALIVFSSTRDALTIFHQGAQKYVPLSGVLLLSGILNAVLMPLGAYLAGLHGLMIGAVLASAVQVMMLSRSCFAQKLNIRVFWNWAIFKRQLGFGLPLRLVDYPQSLLSMLDVLFITRFMDIEVLAIYTTARLIVNMAIEIPARMGMVFITRINEHAVQIGRRQEVANELRDVLIFEYLLLLPAVIYASVLGTSRLIVLLIPNYGKAIPVLKILILTSYFVPQTSIVRNFWVLDKRMVSIGVSNTVGLVGMGAVLCALYLTGRMNLKSMAWAAVAGYVIYYLSLMVTVGLEVWHIKTVALLCLASFIGVGYTYIFAISHIHIVTSEGEISSVILRTIADCFIGLITLSPLFITGMFLILRNRNIKAMAMLVHPILFLKSWLPTRGPS